MGTYDKIVAVLLIFVAMAAVGCTDEPTNICEYDWEWRTTDYIDQYHVAPSGHTYAIVDLYIKNTAGTTITTNLSAWDFVGNNDVVYEPDSATYAVIISHQSIDVLPGEEFTTQFVYLIDDDISSAGLYYYDLDIELKVVDYLDTLPTNICEYDWEWTTTTDYIDQYHVAPSGYTYAVVDLYIRNTANTTISTNPSYWDFVSDNGVVYEPDGATYADIISHQSVDVLPGEEFTTQFVYLIDDDDAVSPARLYYYDLDIELKRIDYLDTLPNICEYDWEWGRTIYIDQYHIAPSGYTYAVVNLYIRNTADTTITTNPSAWEFVGDNGVVYEPDVATYADGIAHQSVYVPPWREFTTRSVYLIDDGVYTASLYYDDGSDIELKRVDYFSKLREEEIPLEWSRELTDEEIYDRGQSALRDIGIVPPSPILDW